MMEITLIPKESEDWSRIERVTAIQVASCSRLDAEHFVGMIVERVLKHYDDTMVGIGFGVEVGA